MKKASPAYIFKFFYGLVGNRIVVLGFLSIITGLFDSFGITLLFPVFELMTNDGKVSNKASVVTAKFQEYFEYFGIPFSLQSMLLVVLAILLLKSGVRMIEQLFKINIHTDINKIVRLRVAEALSKLSYKSYITLNSGAVTGLATTESQRVIATYIYGTDSMLNLLTAVAYLIYVVVLKYEVALITITFGTIYFGLFFLPTRQIRKLSQKITSGNSGFTSILLQSITTFKYLKATNNFGKLKAQALAYLDQVRKLQRKQSSLNALIRALQEPLVVGFIFLLYLILTRFIRVESSIILMTLILFYRCFSYILQFQNSFVSMSNNSGGLYFYTEMSEFFAHNVESKSIDHSEIALEREISVNNVNFEYNPGKPILCNIALTLPRYKTIAFVGRSGSGKSTLVDIISGLLLPTEGTIKVDDISITSDNVQNWRSHIGYITQENIMYNDTIANNISMWDTAEDRDARVQEVLRQAYAREFVDKLEDGIDTEIGERGIMLSGGQRQRLAIARELYRKPDLLILDEATSALDTESERFVQESIDLLKGATTIIVIAHRLSTVINADYIYVMDNGEIVQQGTYRSLLAESDGIFSSLALKQGIDMQ